VALTAPAVQCSVAPVVIFVNTPFHHICFACSLFYFTTVVAVVRREGAVMHRFIPANGLVTDLHNKETQYNKRAPLLFPLPPPSRV
jgi:hypothetical protein